MPRKRAGGGGVTTVKHRHTDREKERHNLGVEG